jgi:seryl-tRNA synthetase
MEQQQQQLLNQEDPKSINRLEKEVKSLILQKLKEVDLKALNVSGKSVSNNVKNARVRLEKNRVILETLLVSLLEIIYKNYSKSKQNNVNSSVLVVKQFTIIFKNSLTNKDILTIIYDSEDHNTSDINNGNNSNTSNNILLLKKLAIMIILQSIRNGQFRTEEEEREYQKIVEGIILYKFSEAYSQYLNEIDTYSLEDIVLSRTSNAQKPIIETELKNILDNFIKNNKNSRK